MSRGYADRGSTRHRRLLRPWVPCRRPSLLCFDDGGLLSEEEQVLIERFRQADARGRATVLAVAESEAHRS